MPGTRRVLRSKLLSLFSFTLEKRTEFPKPLISCNPVTTLHRSTTACRGACRGHLILKAFLMLSDKSTAQGSDQGFERLTQQWWWFPAGTCVTWDWSQSHALLCWLSALSSSLPLHTTWHSYPGRVLLPAQHVSLQTPLPGSLCILKAGEQGSLQTPSSWWAPQEHVGPGQAAS